MLERIRSIADEIFDQVRRLREEIHANPEIGMNTHETANRVASFLESHGIDVRKCAGGSGVTGLFFGDRNGPCVALRADMDALPIQEENDVPYRSRKSGVMHACGHDFHTAVLAGVGIILNRMRDSLPGKVRLIFQPGEESGEGAPAMIADGVMDDPPVDRIFAMHVAPDTPVGQIALTPGASMAAVDHFKIAVMGKGGHGAMPDQANDPIVAAAYLITAIQTVVSRNLSPLDPAVVTVGVIKGGTGFNIIPSTIELEGTIRSLTVPVREPVIGRMKEIMSGLGEAMRVEFRFDCECKSLPVFNDELLSELVGEVSREVLGEGSVRITPPIMGGEDFSCYLDRAPGVLFRLGVLDESRGFTSKIHTPTFDVPEEAISIGMKLMATLALRALET